MLTGLKATNKGSETWDAEPRAESFSNSGSIGCGPANADATDQIMRTVERTPLHQRFLMVGWRVSETAWRTETRSVRQWLDSDECDLPDEQRQKMLAFIDQPLPPTSTPLVILHAYADVGARTTWNLAFDPRQPDDAEQTVAILRFCVLWHRGVTDSLSHGHHQIAVVDFPDGIPALVSSLHEDKQRSDVGYIGLCDATDHDSIASHYAEFR